MLVLLGGGGSGPDIGGDCQPRGAREGACDEVVLAEGERDGAVGAGFGEGGVLAEGLGDRVC